MQFNSLHFLLFLPVVVFLYYVLKERFRWILLLLASCYFYMSFIPSYILILFFIIGVDYLAGIYIEKAEGKKRKLILIFSLIANVSLLGFFKYYNFFIDTISTVTNSDVTKNWYLDIILPIGLSFHTFQSMSYTIDVYRRKQQAEKHLGIFAVYVLFFPQMVAGPIERFKTLGNELKRQHHFKIENLSAGIKLIIYGLFLKMAIADNLADYVNKVYSDPSIYSGAAVFIAMCFFSLQIYADFFGYSLIAIGSARMLDVQLMENFNRPYLSASIDEFWKKWHISLTTWFREYLYVGLGGNQVTKFKWIINILLVFGLSGLWHGANWTFVIWGLFHALLYLVEKVFYKKESYSGTLLIKTLLVIKTFLLVTLAWVFFRAENLEHAFLIFKSVLNTSSSIFPTIPLRLLFLLPLFLLFEFVVFSKKPESWFEKRPLIMRWSFFALIFFFSFALSGIEKHTFIYFQF